MSLKEIVGSMLLGACVAGCVSKSVDVPKPQALIADIDNKGPKEVLETLAADESVFDAVCAEIESGDPLWLEIAQRLKSVSDAGAALSLNYAVARALPREPMRVLRLIGNVFTIDDVCTSPFIEPKAGIAEEYARRARGALLSVEDSQLQSVRDACLSRLTLK